jgi:hypothetical protein
LKSALDFKDKSKQSKRDTVLEENLLDVKNLLKNSAMAQQQSDDAEEKGVEKK